MKLGKEFDTTPALAKIAPKPNTPPLVRPISARDAELPDWAQSRKDSNTIQDPYYTAWIHDQHPYVDLHIPATQHIGVFLTANTARDIILPDSTIVVMWHYNSVSANVYLSYDAVPVIPVAGTDRPIAHLPADEYIWVTSHSRIRVIADADVVLTAELWNRTN